ncbi:MAG: superoxide dismutase [Gammaproteobacteria bacterium HGW-Gammaproteobacteria-8]|nr:MAG: superoxide dismutase [Gammaproteobacteria bacterium HGW-Gammaproteobacteria-8]
MSIAVLLTAAAGLAEAASGAGGQFIDNQGQPIGSVSMIQGPHGVLVNIELNGLAPGAKAIHIHQTGSCDDHAHGFKASGSHVNPEQRQHGLLNPDGPGAGDFPNFHVHADGYAWAEFFNARISLDGSTGVDLLDDNGSAIVIHENVDDHRTQPIGGAGARIACAVIAATD